MRSSLQRPINRSYTQKPEDLGGNLTRRLPELQELAKRTGAVTFFVDEAAVRSDAHRGTTWGRIGETPIVADSGDRFSLRMINAVSPQGAMRFSPFQGTISGERFVGFVCRLRKDVGRPIIVIADNASYHRNCPVQQYAEKESGNVVMDHLPKCPPEPNPDEQVWNHAKDRLARLFARTKEEMTHAIRLIMRSIQAIVRLTMSLLHLADTNCILDAQ